MDSPPRPAVNTSSLERRSPNVQKQDDRTTKSFEDKLRAAEQQHSDADEMVQSKPVLAEKDADLSHFSGQGEDQELTALQDIGVAQRELAASAIEAKASVTGLDPTQQAHLERMAAAIAEAVGKGAQNVFSVDFGANALLIDSAIISKDATAGLTIRLTAPHGAITPAAWAVLKNNLEDRLEKRKISAKLIVESKDKPS